MQQYFSKSKKDNTLYLHEYDFNHIKNVMRMKENDEIIVVYDKTSYICSLNKDLTSCNIKSVFKSEEDLNEFVVYVPFLVDEKMSYIFKHGTELGITKFVVVEYAHCKYKLPKKDYEKKLTRWNKIIKEATEQSYRITKPELKSIISPKNIECIPGVNIMCSLDNANVKSICKVLTPKNSHDKISLVFGPEGGLSKIEEDMLEEKGFIKTSLGNDVLRTETVPLTIASILKYLKEWDKNGEL